MDLKDYVLFKVGVSTPISEGYFDTNWNFSDAEKSRITASGAAALKK
jgi:hypothetical protein